MFTRIFFAIALLVSFGCSSKKVLSENNAVTQGPVKVWANWVKDKGEKFDIQFLMENIHTKPVIVKLHDVQCARGKRGGNLQHTFFNTGERTIDIMPGEVKQFNFVCTVGVKTAGAFNMRLNRVYDNPEKDGATLGKVIAKNIIWSTSDED